MKKKIVYTDEPLGDFKIIKDFLPPGTKLIFKEETVKVTVPLSKHSLGVLKKQARKRHVSYEQMISALVDKYASHYDNQ